MVRARQDGTLNKSSRLAKPKMNVEGSLEGRCGQTLELTRLSRTLTDGDGRKPILDFSARVAIANGCTTSSGHIQTASTRLREEIMYISLRSLVLTSERCLWFCLHCTLGVYLGRHTWIMYLFLSFRLIQHTIIFLDHGTHPIYDK